MSKSKTPDLNYQPETGRVVPLSPKGRTYEPLTLSYLARAVEAFLRAPSPKLTESFRTDLLHWRALTGEALKARKTHGEALLTITQALAISDSNLMAVRYLRSAASQLLWLTTVDIGRDRRGNENPPTELEHERFGDPTLDQDYVAPPTEDGARDAYLEAHSWLSSIADLLPVDDAERAFLNLDSGLEFATVRETDVDGSTVYRPVFDVDEALEIQMKKNEDAFAQRAARNVERKAEAFAALARLVA